MQKNVKTKEKYKSGKKKGQYKTKKVWFYRPTLYGKSLDITAGATSITESTGRSGTTIKVTPAFYGRVYQDPSWIFPNYNRLFDRSNIGGAFTWKGDPRMQPRDVVNFHRVDPDSNGNEVVELITIESISLIHEGGGTKATIAYRKGIC